jgi:hypothetical protein
MADTCAAAQNETGTLLGTAFVARDMMRIVDALGEDGLLRFWGKFVACVPAVSSILAKGSTD